MPKLESSLKELIKKVWQEKEKKNVNKNMCQDVSEAIGGAEVRMV